MRQVPTRHIVSFVSLAFLSTAWPLAARLPAPDATRAAGRPAPGREAWLRVETPNFSLFGEVSRARLLAVAGRLEEFRAALEQLHPGSRTSPRETFVYVFKDAESGWPYTPAAAADGHHLGVSPPYDVGNYVTLAAPVDDPPLEVLYHSYAHQFLDDNFPRLPLTVTEGLAEFYSGFAIAREGTFIGLMNADHLSWLRENAAMSLPEQFALDARDPRLSGAAGRKAFVAGSWAFMHYLASGIGPGRAGLPVFLEALQRGTPPGDAARSAFGASLEQLQQAVAQYVRGTRFLPIRIRAGPSGAGAPATSPDADAFQEHPMRRDEVIAALGDVLAHAGTRRAADAEAYFDKALRLNPDQARAHSGLGYLRFAQNRFGEAIPSLERAIASEPDAMSCYLLARSLLKINAPAATVPAATTAVAVAPTTGARPGQAGAPLPDAAPAVVTPPWLERARDLLARAIALRPRFAAPYVTLGATHTLPDGDVAAGIAVLQKARLMLPARTDIPGTLVYLLLRQGDLVRAQALVDEVLVHGGDEESLRTARAAIGTFRQNAVANQEVSKMRLTPEQEARRKALRAERARILREELARTKDPEARAKIEEMLKQLEGSRSTVGYDTVAEVYNQAVDRANKRDYAQAIVLLEGLLPKIEDMEQRAMIESLLERFRKDAGRLQQPVQ